jgi:hypothetical protein
VKKLAKCENVEDKKIVIVTLSTRMLKLLKLQLMMFLLDVNFEAKAADILALNVVKTTMSLVTMTAQVNHEAEAVDVLALNVVTTTMSLVMTALGNQGTPLGNRKTLLVSHVNEKIVTIPLVNLVTTIRLTWPEKLKLLKNLMPHLEAGAVDALALNATSLVTMTAPGNQKMQLVNHVIEVVMILLANLVTKIRLVWLEKLRPLKLLLTSLLDVIFETEAVDVLALNVMYLVVMLKM